MYVENIDYNIIFWDTEGEKTNPGAGVILAQNAPVEAGFYRPHFCIAGSTTEATYYNVGIYIDGTGWLRKQIVRVPANGFIVFDLGGFFYLMGANERFVIEVRSAITGTVQASIRMWKKLET
jgi:hypothetical protein